MSTIAELIVRVGLTLQDEDHVAWTLDQKRAQLSDEIQRLSRRGLFGNIVWRQAVAGTATYNLPDTTIGVETVCYDGKTLRVASERGLSIKDPSWEQRANRPQYYTDELQSHGAVRLVPAPLNTGSAVPVLPPLPLLNEIDGNVVVFTSDNPQGSDGPEQDCRVPDWLEDALVFKAASVLCGDKGDYQDLEKSVMLGHLADLYLSCLSSDLDLDAWV